MNTKANFLLSIIIPVHNEQDNIQPVLDALEKSLGSVNYEIFFIDDGSTDDTLANIKARCLQNEKIQYISFTRNFGHQNALKAGYDHALGDCVVTLDGDLQHPPELIPQMIDMWKSGIDVVQSRRLAEPNQAAFKKYSSGLYYTIFRYCSNVTLASGAADFRLLDRKVVEYCKNSTDDNFFWRGFIPWLGFSQALLDYTPKARLHGSSKYNIPKMFKLAWGGISSFSMLPLRMASVFGGLGLLLSCIYIVYVLVHTLLGNTVPGWSSLMIVLLFFGSAQLLGLGVLGEYLGRVYLKCKNRPSYVVNEKSIPPRQSM